MKQEQTMIIAVIIAGMTVALTAAAYVIGAALFTMSINNIDEGDNL